MLPDCQLKHYVSSNVANLILSDEINIIFHYMRGYKLYFSLKVQPNNIALLPQSFYII